MANSIDNQPLANDPAREAAASMRGYSTQVWRSVLAWIDLGNAERLYLEGAEDIDRVSGLAAETIQIKDVQGNITLRSGDVIEAIDNAWAHRQRNPTRTIRFRFLTTSRITVERGAPFGDGVGGLNLWRHARLSDDEAGRHRDARAIATFLVAEGKVSAPVRAFLQTGSDAAIWEGLIAPVEWDTEAEEAPEVIREIKDRLVVLGQTMGITPDKAEDVAAHLYEIAYGTATRQKDRFLTRAELLRVFHARTHVSIPAATCNALLAIIPQHLATLGADGVLPQAVGGTRSVVGRAPPLPSRYYARGAVLGDIDRRLAVHPILVLQGGTGVGKSIAAAGHVAASTLSWGWVDLRGVHSAALTSLLDRVVAELTAESGLTHVVLDDIELPPDPRPLETPLTRIKTILGDRGGHLVITSTAVLPQRLALALALPADGMLPIPAFSRDEITEFLIARGCAAPKVAGWWAAFIALHTSGHAQLVHARIATLEAQGFPTPDLENLATTPSDVVEARAEARRLIATLDGPTREFIYRLSLTVQALPLQQVLAIARHPAPIDEPGLVFDGLVGPWVEVVAEGLYRVSPLLREVGKDVQGEDWATGMHCGIARAILDCRTLSPTDVSAILFHCIAGRDWASVARLSFGILQSDNETWDALAASADWFVLVGTGTAARPETDRFSLFLIRLLQFRLAAAAKNDRGARAIIARVNEELPADVAGALLRLARYFFLAQVLLRTEVNLPIAQLVSIGLEYVRLTDELADVLAEAHGSEFDPVLTGPDGAPDIASIAGFTLTPHLVDRQAFEVLVDASEPLDATEVRRLLWFIGGQEPAARIVLERLCQAELRAAVPDWFGLRDVLRRAYTLGRRCGLSGLAQSTARTIARITDEYLKDPVEALQLADAMGAEIGWSPGQKDGRAEILLRKGEALEALAIWRDLLPSWRPESEFDLQQTFSHRRAAIAAAQLHEWKEAADSLQSARDLADDMNQATYCAGLLVDEGYARWKGGDNDAALRCLVDGLGAIDRLPADDTDDDIFLLRKRAGHTLMWIANTSAGKPPAGFVAPPPACCSSSASVKEADLPSTPSDIMWLALLEFEFVARLGDTQFRAHEAHLKTSVYGMVRLSFNQLRLQRRLRSAVLNDLVEIVGDWAESFTLCRLYYKEDGFQATDPLPPSAISVDREQLDAELILCGMLNGIFVLAARDGVTEQILSLWKISAAQAGLSAALEPWLTFVGNLFIGKTVDTEKAIRDPQLSWPWQGAASVKVAIDCDTGPADLLTIHEYWTGGRMRAAIEPYVLPEVERLVTSSWQRLAARRFLLRTPMVTAPALLHACASASMGWCKISEVLVAACDAVPAKIPGEFRKKFRDLK